MRRPLIIAAVVVGALVVGVGGTYAYLKYENRNAPPPARLSAVSPAPPGAPTTASTPGVAGRWTATPGPASFVGYRVNEKLASLPVNSDAVGRSSAVQATMTIEGTTVKTVDVTADLSQLQSDQGQRDRAIRSRGLETNKFPMATFSLSKPIDLPAAPDGQSFQVTASGRLTLHGVTRDVDIPLEARRTGSSAEVVGHFDLDFSDYQINPPNIAGFVSVDSKGTMELDLHFERS